MVAGNAKRHQLGDGGLVAVVARSDLSAGGGVVDLLVAALQAVLELCGVLPNVMQQADCPPNVLPADIGKKPSSHLACCFEVILEPVPFALAFSGAVGVPRFS